MTELELVSTRLRAATKPYGSRLMVVRDKPCGHCAGSGSSDAEALVPRDWCSA